MTNYAITTDSLQSYLREVNRYPLLTQKEEYDISERYWKLHNIEDAHKLVASNLRYVIKIALEYRDYGCRVADLIQEGNIGLMMAVKRFDPYKGYRLITYATWWIRAFIQDFILKTTGLVKRGVRTLKKKLFYKKPAAINSGETPDAEGACPRMSLDRNIRGQAEAGAHADMYYDLSLNSPVGTDGVTHLDMLKDPGPGQEEIVAAKESAAIVKREVSSAFRVLNDKERLVIEKRVMSHEPASLQGIGDKLGLTRERVRQIEASALKKLEKALGKKLYLLKALQAENL
ncbi:MAG: sigma-70 family RNA polymerase sigma factor [Deltaproteobacteria bacterium]|nr:sigma-70 family RNA polymerase sigma factor [Deltaproteobacteria bacterium]